MIDQHDVSNGLISALPFEEYKIIQPHLSWIDLTIKEILQIPNEVISRALFPVSGICSVLAVAKGVQIEAGIIGREGFVGLPIVLDALQAPYKVIVQGGGRAVSMSAVNLLQVLRKCSRLRANLLRFAHIFEVQISQTALANGSFTIEKRLARWLLMCQDRVQRAEFAITHEFLSTMLSVRRSGVTVALQKLEGKRIIKSMRGKIEILNRTALLVLAENAYGVPEAEYERLIG